MKRKVWIGIVALMIAAALAMVLVGCSNGELPKGNTQVIYKLEGGTYKNSTLDVVQYYDVEEGGTSYILDPVSLSKQEFLYAEHRLAGWYRTKTVDGDTVTYSDPWDFATDKIGAEGVTLYAYWRPNVRYTYNVCYVDEDGERQVLGEYEVDEGNVFNDYKDYCDERDGYTFVGYINQDGTPWDDTTRHPGGETDCQVDVYCAYVKGEYERVYSAFDLVMHCEDNILLMNDIDMSGEDAFCWEDFKGSIEGQGYTISNMVLAYSDRKNDLCTDPFDDSKKSLQISLFGAAQGEDAEHPNKISNLNLVNVTVTVHTINSMITGNIYVAPLAIGGSNVIYDNVNVDITITVTAATLEGWPDLVLADEACLYCEGVTVNDNCNIQVTYVVPQ